MSFPNYRHSRAYLGASDEERIEMDYAYADQMIDLTEDERAEYQFNHRQSPGATPSSAD